VAISDTFNSLRSGVDSLFKRTGLSGSQSRAQKQDPTQVPNPGQFGPGQRSRTAHSPQRAHLGDPATIQRNPYQGHDLSTPPLVGGGGGGGAGPGGAPEGFDWYGLLDKYKHIQKSAFDIYGRQLPAAAAMAMTMHEGFGDGTGINESFWPSHASLGKYWSVVAPQVGAAAFDQSPIGQGLKAAGVQGAGEVATDVVMGTAEFAEETILEPWEVIFVRAGISGGQYANQARVGLERALGYDSKIENRTDPVELFRSLVGDELVEKAIDDKELAKSIAWAGLDVAGASLFKTLGKTVPKITKGLQGVAVGGITYGTAADVIDKANNGELSAKDTAEILIAGLGSLVMTKVAMGYVTKLATPQMRKAVGRQLGKAASKLAEEAGYLDNPFARDEAANAAGRRLGIERIQLEEQLARLERRVDEARKAGLSGEELNPLNVMFDEASSRLDEVVKIQQSRELGAVQRRYKENRGQPIPEYTPGGGEEAFVRQDPPVTGQTFTPADPVPGRGKATAIELEGGTEIIPPDLEAQRLKLRRLSVEMEQADIAAQAKIADDEGAEFIAKERERIQAELDKLPARDEAINKRLEETNDIDAFNAEMRTLQDDKQRLTQELDDVADSVVAATSGKVNSRMQALEQEAEKLKAAEERAEIAAGAKRLREERGRPERTATGGEEAFVRQAAQQNQTPVVHANGMIDESVQPTSYGESARKHTWANSKPPRGSRREVSGTEAELYGADREPLNVTEMTDDEIAFHASAVGVESKDVQTMVRDMDTTVDMLRTHADDLPADDPMRQETLAIARDATRLKDRTGWIHKARRALVSPVRNIIRGYGEAGTKIMKMFDEGMLEAEALTGEDVAKATEVMNGMTDDELHKLGRALREDGQVHPDVRIAYDVIKGLFDNLLKGAYDAGGREALDAQERRFKEAFPDLHTTASLVDPTKRAALIEFLEKTGKARNPEDATAMVDAALLASEGRVEVAIGNQIFQTQSGVARANLDPTENLEALIYQSYKEIHQIGTREELSSALNQIFDEVGSEKAEFTRKAFSRMLGEDKRGVDEFGMPTATAKVSAALRKFAIVTMLNPLSTVANATQGPLNSLLIVDSKSWLKAAGKSIFASRHAKKMVETTGAITSSVINDSLNAKVGSSGEGMTSKWMKWIGFRSVEIHNNKFAATAGIYYVDNLLTKLEKRPNSWRTRSRLKEIGLDPDKLTKEGITDATRELAKRLGGNQVARQTQFRADVADLPMFWTHPVGKVVFQFQSFAYHQARLTSRALWNETIKRQNPRPLVTVLGLMGVTGKGISEIREAYTGKEYSHDTALDEWLYYISLTGGVGLANDFMTGQAEASSTWLAKRLSGPTGNTIADGVDALNRNTAHNNELEKFTGKRFPGLGPAIEGRLVTDEGFGVEDVDTKNLYRRVAGIERQRKTEIDQIMELHWGGSREQAQLQAESIGYELTESKAERRRRDEIQAVGAKAAKRLDDIPDEDWRKKREMYRSFPEVAPHWEHVAQQDDFWKADMSSEMATGKERTLWLQRKRVSWRENVAEPVIQNLIDQADDDTAHAWTKFREYWRARNDDLEARHLSPNSVYNEEQRNKFEAYITDWMAYDDGFNEQMTLLPADLFRR
jgi:hypothetical protein